MPIACGNTLLTGSNGSVAFKAPGTGGCLLDFSDFNDTANDTIPLPDCSTLVAGDCVQFEAVDGASLDSGVVEGNCYCIENIDADGNATFDGITLQGDGGEASVIGTLTGLATADGTVTGSSPGADLTDGVYPAVTLFYHSTNNSQQNGMLGTADVTVAGGVVTAVAVDNPGREYAVNELLTANLPGEAGKTSPVFGVESVAAGQADTEGAHVAMSLCDFMYVCNVKSFSLNLDREQLDSTALMCDCTASGTGCFAPFKTYQGGYIDGTGSIEVMFSEDQNSISGRFITGSLLKDQAGAEVRLYINTVCDSNGNIDEEASIYLEAPITILGFSLNVAPDEITTATINFALSGQPTHFG